ncbi:hypothetical protein HDU97_009842 [Phlyctochytrium planicorne]|nr:hypothetical protein HDU97_009842 [Phlyctochytrium planicorne]
MKAEYPDGPPESLEATSATSATSAASQPVNGDLHSYGDDTSKLATPGTTSAEADFEDLASYVTESVPATEDE